MKKLFTASLVFMLLANAFAVKNDVIINDFEDSSYGSWFVSGKAFGSGPVHGTLPGQQTVKGYLGDRLVNSFLEGDASTGRLTSPIFTIERDYINFLIGGGYHPEQTYIQLIVDDKPVKSATGRNMELLTWHTWNVREYKGKSARIEIMDKQTGGWGHINVDQIYQSNEPKLKHDNLYVAKAMANVQRFVSQVEKDPRRPAYHFASPALWMNDINGPIYLDGWYHIFYQHNPYGDQWGHMHWGHARSRDLVHWEHLPIALWPSFSKGEEHCFSGCTAVNEQGTPLIFYTSIGHELPEQWVAEGGKDLMNWRKCEENPFLEMSDHNGTFIEDWRDPFIFEHADRTFMVLGGKLKPADGGEAVATIYEANDGTLLDWSYKGILFRHPDKDLRSLECPNFFPLADKFVLLDSPYGPVEYFVGNFDVDTCEFTAASKGLIDFTDDYYATNVVYGPDGRCILLGWVRNFKPDQGWNGVMALPRTISLDDSGALIQEPVAETNKLRTDESKIGSIQVDDGTETIVDDAGRTFELFVEVDRGSADSCVLQLCASENNRDAVELVLTPGILKIDGAEVAIEKDPVTNLRIFFDRAVLEVFVNDGKNVFTKVVYPPLQNRTIRFHATNGTAEIRDMIFYRLTSTN